MQGFPPLRALIVFILMALCASPIHRLVQDRVARISETAATGRLEAAGDPQSHTRILPTRILWKTSHPPKSISITQDGKELWKGHAEDEPELSLAYDVSENDPRLDLEIRAEGFEIETEAALQITLEPQGLEEKTETLWGVETIDEEVRWIWKPL